MHADGAHATSWATCVGPGTCNLTQDLSHDGGSPSSLPPFCLNRESSAPEFGKPHTDLKPESRDVSWRNRYHCVRTIESVFDLCMNCLSRILQMGVIRTMLCFSGLLSFSCFHTRFPVVAITCDLSQDVVIDVILNLQELNWKLVEESGCQARGRRGRFPGL
jgi:hypothetical protein